MLDLSLTFQLRCLQSNKASYCKYSQLYILNICLIFVYYFLNRNIRFVPMSSLRAFSCKTLINRARNTVSFFWFAEFTLPMSEYGLENGVPKHLIGYHSFISIMCIYIYIVYAVKTLTMDGKPRYQFTSHIRELWLWHVMASLNRYGLPHNYPLLLSNIVVVVIHFVWVFVF